MKRNASKLLLLGKSGSGKTSMRSIIFANYVARDTSKLTPTWLFDNTDIKFLNNLVLNLWDCGGQDSFMEKYFESQREQIFRNCEVLIYVFDVESLEHEKDMHYFKRCLNAIQENSKEAQIFCLIHKMDTVPEDLRLSIFTERANELTALAQDGMHITCFGTSIWDETLYKAWSAIVYSLIPNVEQLQLPLHRFCNLCRADEVVLFERATFLVISSAEKNQETQLMADAHRHEKISTIVKQFKLACAKAQSQFKCMEVKTRQFTAYIDVLTPNTYIMVITRDPRILSTSLKMSVEAIRPIFDSLV